VGSSDSEAGSIACRVDVNGTRCLALRTGLDQAAFAQAKLHSLITQPGRIVAPDGVIRDWMPEGVSAPEGVMLVYGPDFSGRSLLGILEDSDSDPLDTVRVVLKARRRLREASTTASTPNEEAPRRFVPSLELIPAGTLIGDDGSVLFMPERLVARALESLTSLARLDGAIRWHHPDLSGKDAWAFADAVLVYRALCGKDAFPGADEDAVRNDMRDSCALPARMACPGLDSALATLLDAALKGETGAARNIRAPVSSQKPNRSSPGAPLATQRPSADAILEALGEPGSGGSERFIHILSSGEQAALDAGKARYLKSTGAAIGAKRFTKKYSTLLMVGLVSLVAVVFIVRGILVSRSERPNTLGLSPVQVVERYYQAFGQLDHQFMEAAVHGKAGKGDIDMITNLFVISRVRMAYEHKEAIVSAEKWKAEGSPSTDALVFGVTDLRLQALDGDATDGETSYVASYTLWRPSEAPADADQVSGTGQVSETGQTGQANANSPQQTPPAARPPEADKREDTLRIHLVKGAWRIDEIQRTLK